MTLLLILGVLILSLTVSSKLSDMIKAQRKDMDDVHMSIAALNQRNDDLEEHKHIRGKVVLPPHD